MKTKLLTLALLTFVLSASLTSCKKKEKEPEPSPKELLTKATWNIYVMEEYDSSGNMTGSSPYNWEWELTVSNKYYTFDNAGNLLVYGEYSLNENADPMMLSLMPHGSSSVYEYEILKLTDTEFEVKYTFPAGNYFIFKSRR